MYKILTTSLVLTFASLALAQTTEIVTETDTVTVTFTPSATDTTDTTESTSTSSFSAPTSTSSAPPVIHTVIVAFNGTLTYNPNNFNASVGDEVAFYFNPRNHSVTQSSFEDPCQSLEDTTGIPGFDSGLVPTQVDLDTASFTLVINDTDPVWAFCKQLSPESHCRLGMVLGINTPQTGDNFSAFLAKAMANSSSSTTPSSSISKSSTSSATSSATAASSSTSTSSSGAIPTSVNVGLTAVLAVVGVVVSVL